MNAIVIAYLFLILLSMVLLLDLSFTFLRCRPAS